MKITFMDVGQGDSIIQEWKDNGIDKTGIIDCKIYQDTNPIINELKKKNITEIDFIALSHPHQSTSKIHIYKPNSRAALI